MSNDFIPAGGARVSRAIWFLATKRRADLWDLARLEAGEQHFWTEIINDNADPLGAVLEHIAAGNEVLSGLADRVQSYVSAENEVRQALYAGKIQAFFISSEAATLGQLMHVLAPGWGTEAGFEILRWGRADLEGEQPGRLIFFDIGLFNGAFAIGGAAKQNAASPASMPASVKGKRGRPPSFPWGEIEKEAMRLLDENGGIDPSDDVLPNQAALEKLVLDWCADRELHPSVSSVRTKLPIWISAYNAGATRS